MIEPSTFGLWGFDQRVWLLLPMPFWEWSLVLPAESSEGMGKLRCRSPVCFSVWRVGAGREGERVEGGGRVVVVYSPPAHIRTKGRREGGERAKSLPPSPSYRT